MKSHPLPNAYRRYRQQAHRIRMQGEEFLITFEQWYAWWQDQGIDKNYAIDSMQPRPAGPNRGCMARRNPLKPWTIRNIVCRDKPGHTGNPAPVGVRNARSRGLLTPDGEFESISAAARHYGITCQSMVDRQRRHPDLYQDL
jgi:hypothetical protein